MHDIFDRYVRKIQTYTGFDEQAARASNLVGTIVHKPKISTILSGTILGHPLHPALTDLPIGFWTSAMALDMCGGESSRRGAKTLIGMGVLSSIPTALTGMSDWSDTSETRKRIGAVHGLLNGGAVALYSLSWFARRRNQRTTGLALSLLGAVVVSGAAALGGHLVYRKGVGVDVNSSYDDYVSEWKSATEHSLPNVPALLLRTEDAEVLSIDKPGELCGGIGARCSHRGGPLAEGRFTNGCVTCPWHGAIFRLSDGTVVSGPATAPQPQYEVRRSSGDTELRRVP